MSGAKTVLDVTVAGKLAPKFRLEAVNFGVISGRVVDTEDREKAGALDWKLDQVDIRWLPIDDQVRSIVPFTIRISSTVDNEPKCVLIVNVVIRVDYVAPADEELPPDDEVSHFVGVMAFMHSWPYLRAEAQSLTSKLGLPALTLPALLSGHVPGLAKASRGLPPQDDRPSSASLAPPAPKVKRAKKRKKLASGE